MLNNDHGRKKKENKIFEILHTQITENSVIIMHLSNVKILCLEVSKRVQIENKMLVYKTKIVQTTTQF